MAEMLRCVRMTGVAIYLTGSFRAGCECSVMNREYHRCYSYSLERDMELLVFGHAGARVVVFPTSIGRFFQWEDFGMIAALRDQLEQGDIQLFCVDSVDGESWYARWRPPSERAWRPTEEG